MTRPIRLTLITLGVILCIYLVIDTLSLFSHAGMGFFIPATLGGLVIWREGLKQGRLAEDLATSRIASAAQGYVELVGHAASASDTQPLRSPEGRPCLWYEHRVAVMVKVPRSPIPLWAPQSATHSNQPFVIRDDSGEALVFPGEADMIGAHTDIKFRDNFQITESIIRVDDPLYVVGDFTTEHESFDWHAQVETLTSEWKNDPDTVQGFDTDQDGKLDAHELRRLDAAVRAEASRRIETNSTSGLHVIRRPTDNKRFLVAARTPEELINENFFWSALGLTQFFFCGLITASIVIRSILEQH